MTGIRLAMGLWFIMFNLVIKSGIVYRMMSGSVKILLKKAGCGE
jgi:hypothetical protein